MREKIEFNLTKKEQEIIEEFLEIWRNKKFKGGEIVIIFHNYEPQGIIYKQRKSLGGLDKGIRDKVLLDNN